MAEKPDESTYDYVGAGRMQLVMVTLAFMQTSYWYSIGRSHAIESNKFSEVLITGMDWASAMLCVLAIPILLRGIYLIRKGGRKGSMAA